MELTWWFHDWPKVTEGTSATPCLLVLALGTGREGFWADRQCTPHGYRVAKVSVDRAEGAEVQSSAPQTVARS